MSDTHVVLLTQFFHPDVSAIAQIGTDLAEDLVALGFRVTAIAGRGTYLGGEQLPDEEEFRGVRIARLRSSSLGKGKLSTRLTDYVSFSMSASLNLALAKRPDLILAMSTPPFVPVIAAILRLCRGIKFAYWAQDLYPELAVAFGLLRPDSLMTRALERVSSTVLRQADAVVTVGDAMAATLISKGADPASTHVIPNWADPEAVKPIDHPNNEFRSAQGLQGKRVILYSGNMGRSHDIQTILEAAEAMRDSVDMAWVFIGDGSKRALVQEAARRNPCVRWLPYQPRSALSQSLGAADVHIVSQEAQTLGLMEPSKIYGVMAAARPVLVIGPSRSEVAQTVIEEQIGEVVANGDVYAAVAAIRRLLETGRDMGLRARAAMEGKRGRKARTSSIATVLSAVAAGGRRRPH